MGDVADRAKVPPNPMILEIDTWPWLTALSERERRPIDLGSVPTSVWDSIADAGYDLVWLMGVWKRSPAGIAIALAIPDLVESFRRALPDFEEADVVGSPYCVRDYAADPRLGGRDGLAAARAELRQRGVRLLLDFVPNHVAPDHPWVAASPDRFVLGDAADLQRDPVTFVELNGRVFAHGRDPFFPAWPDVVQLNAFSSELRAAVVETLGDIAGQCDGVRCDMAMLMMDDVFDRTWGERVGPAPETAYWPEIIEAVRRVHPAFLFLAEAYWDREYALQQEGFDFCYDKRLYDRLVGSEPGASVTAHLSAGTAYQARLVRFLENHDEPRAASVLDPVQHRAAAIATLTQCGARLVHDGQTAGRRTRLPVFLGRFPDEPDDTDLEAFYHRLLAALTDLTFREGQWQLVETTGWEGNQSAGQVVSWSWEGPSRWLVVVNLGPGPAAAHVAAAWPDLKGRTLLLRDPTQGLSFERSGDDLNDGLYVELPGWGWHLLQVTDGENEDSDTSERADSTEEGAP